MQGGGLLNKGRYGCAGPSIRFFEPKFCLSIRFYQRLSAVFLYFENLLPKLLVKLTKSCPGFMFFSKFCLAYLYTACRTFHAHASIYLYVYLGVPLSKL